MADLWKLGEWGAGLHDRSGRSSTARAGSQSARTSPASCAGERPEGIEGRLFMLQKKKGVSVPRTGNKSGPRATRGEEKQRYVQVGKIGGVFFANTSPGDTGSNCHVFFLGFIAGFRATSRVVETASRSQVPSLSSDLSNLSSKLVALRSCRRISVPPRPLVV